MAYATADDVTDVMRLQLAADLSADSGKSPDDTLLNTVLADASSLMDGYLGSRYAVPIVSPAATLAILKVYCLSIGKYLLLERSAVVKYDQAAKDRYDDAIRFMRDIATKKISLVGVSDAAVPEMTTASGASGSEGQVFGDPETIQGGML